jgi:hypothetical protein
VGSAAVINSEWKKSASELLQRDPARYWLFVAACKGRNFCLRRTCEQLGIARNTGQGIRIRECLW